MKAQDIAAVELWVGNARQASSWFARAFGFDVAGLLPGEEGSQDRVSYLLRQGEIRLIVTGATRRDSPVNDFVARHGDGVRDIFLSVEGPAGRDAVEGFGDTRHSLVGDGAAHPRLSFPEDGRSTEPDGRGAVGLRQVDHVAVSVGPDERESLVLRYERELSFGRLGPAADLIEVDGSAFTMTSVRATGGRATLVFAAPAQGPSQIADFLVEYGGAGVHHLAFATGDIVATASALRARGVRFLSVPVAYYQQARDRLDGVDLPWEQLEGLGILVDRDEDGVLLQAFTEPVGDRPTMYFEIIQRSGATGFGADNIRALYHAVVLAQAAKS